MPADLEFRLLGAWVWKCWSQTGVWARPIVVSRPQLEDLSDMVLIERNHEIQAFSPCATDQALTKCICLRSAVRRSQHLQTQGSQ